MRIRDTARCVLGSEYFDALCSPPDPAPRSELQVPPLPPRPERPRLWSSASHAGGGSFAAGASSALLCNTNQSVSSFEVQHDLSDLKDVDFVNRMYYTGVDVPVGRLVPICKKNDGKMCFCKQTVSGPPPAPPSVSKPSTSSKPARRRKAVDAVNAYDPYVYYGGFGPSRSKRYSKGSGNSILQEIPSVVEQQENPPSELQQEKPAHQGQCSR